MKKIKVGDLIQFKFREEDNEVCLVLEILNNKKLLVQRSSQRSYEKSMRAIVNPMFYDVLNEQR